MWVTRNDHSTSPLSHCTLRYGSPPRIGGNTSDATVERSFFLPPYWELVELTWSRGRRRERRDLRITTFDVRPQVCTGGHQSGSSQRCARDSYYLP